MGRPAATSPQLPVYVASPLGFTLPTRIFYSRTLLPALRANGAEILDPWDVPSPTMSIAASAHPGSPVASVGDAFRQLGDRNEGLLRRARAVFAVLDGPDVDSGTASEIGFAVALRKPVVGWRSDIRRAGEFSEARINLQVEHFIRSSGGSVQTDLGAAVDALRAILADLRSHPMR